MQTPEEVTAMLRLKALGWGVRRMAGELEVRAMPRTAGQMFRASTKPSRSF